MADKQAGKKLKQLRLDRRLSMRDVQKASKWIATLKGNRRYTLPISRLSDYENAGTTPSIYRLYSLARTYRTRLQKLPRIYDITC